LDLGLDSLERVELLTMLERKQGTRVAADVRARIFTVRQLVEAVIAAPSEAAGGAGDDADALPWDSLLIGSPDPDLAARLNRYGWARAIFFFILLRVIG